MSELASESSSGSSTQPRSLSIVNARVFDGVSDELIDGPVHVVDGRITEVGPGASATADRVIRAAVELARAAGVRIGFGTDLMGALEDEQLGGLRLQTEVEGVARALQAATSVNADLLGRPDLGRVQADCVADLLVVDGDPFADPSLLWTPTRPPSVIKAGVAAGGPGHVS